MIERGLGALTQGGLSHLEARVHCQMGEDGVIAGIFERLGENTPGSFLDVGAGGAGQGISNTLALAERGWSGALLDADEAEVVRLRALHAGRPVVVAAATVSGASIGPLCEQLGVAQPLTVASFDVDGDDLWIWRALPRRPRLVVIEYNAHLPLDDRIAQPAGAGPWTGTDFFGASLGALDWLADRLGYALVHTDAVNAFFVRAEDAASALQGEIPVRRSVIARLPRDGSGRQYIDPRDAP